MFYNVDDANFLRLLKPGKCQSPAALAPGSERCPGQSDGAAEQLLLRVRGSLLLHTGFSSACLNELIQP